MMRGIAAVTAAVWSVVAYAADDAKPDVGSQFLSFIDSTASLLGSALAWLIGLVLPGTVDPSLVKPLGYLGLLTVLLFLFSLMEAARRVIWIVVAVGWVLMIARILIEALHR